MTANKNIIDNLKQYNKDKGSKPIFILSLGRDVLFSPLTTKHQKMILASNFDNPIANTTFHLNVFKILRETCSKPDLIDTLSLLDKDVILIQLRYYFISEEYKEESMANTIEKIKKLNLLTLSDEIIDGDIKVSVNIPTIVQENKILNQFLNYKEYDISFKTSEEWRDVIGDIYVLELVKYLQTISIDDDMIVFDDWSIEDKISIVENLSKSITDKVAKYIERVREPLEEVYELPNGKRVSVSPEFFI